MSSLQPCAATHGARIEIADGRSLVGGGSTPAQSLPTKLLRIKSDRYSTSDIEARLRKGPGGIPVIARIEDESLLLDLRTVFPDQEAALASAVAACLA